jgi:ABC-type amino acid transport system permease subunit
VHIPIATWVARGYVLVIRGTPLLIQLFLVYYALPELVGINFSPLVAGFITMGLNSAAYVSEIVRGGINSIASGQWEAALALGYQKHTTLRYVILPQALKTILPPLLNEAVSLVKESSTLSFIGLLELSRVAMNISARTLDPLGAQTSVAIIYLILTTAMSYGAHLWEKSITLEVSHDHH